MIDFADNLDTEWTLTTDSGKIISLPCCPWIIMHVPKLQRFKIVCEYSIYFVYESEAKRMMSLAKLHRSAQLLNHALKEMIRE
jgi:hypothetical protein